MDWTRGHTLGCGSTATVSLATSLLSCDVFAVKSAELDQSQFLQREQKILSSLSSPHIVGYMGFDITRENNKLMYNLFLEYIPGGTLTDAVHAQGGRLEESVIGCYTGHIVQGLEYLHSNGWVHCDIKGRNVLIGQTGAKIADFGCAKRVDSVEDAAEAATPIGGTPMFMAPEVARGEEQGFASDIWALGCTIIEMASGGAALWSDANDPVSVIILDQGFWNSMDESESEKVDNLVPSSDESSAKERIRRLSLLSGGPSWNWDENWIPIRGNCRRDGDTMMDSIEAKDDVINYSSVYQESYGGGEQLSDDLLDSNINNRISGDFWVPKSCGTHMFAQSKANLSEEEENDMLDYLYTSQYQMHGIVAISLGRISNDTVENYTHAVFMRFQRKEDVAKFYENPFYLKVLKERVIPHCHGIINVDYESEVEDDILPIFRKGEEFNYGVEFVHLIAFDESASGAPVEDALVSLEKLMKELPSLVVQSTQGSNFNVSSQEYSHAVVTRFRSSEAFEMFVGSAEYKDVNVCAVLGVKVKVQKEVALLDSKELENKLHEMLDEEEQDKEDDIQEVVDEGPTVDDGEQSSS
ncbi:hypothetical protein GH714_032626 [Hevea brasiliensis]|uniref:Protein kinase domain-containing protein n=1 Tax=Hevea brasiliensis TaxID=3981 RepID=A0A6A6KAA8_HEVBR|nr:hypothetical protein GH714_032626 [Hevea brasiliensis]